MPNVAASPPSSAVTQPRGVWERSTFENLQTLLGGDKLDAIVVRFWADLCRRFEDLNDGELLRKDAHAVKSTAGMLGFVELSATAQALENAVSGGEPYGLLVAPLLAARQDLGNFLSSRSDPNVASRILQREIGS